MGERIVADVAVVGGGVIGCATAYELARRGVDVVVLEAATVSSGASGASAGGVRQQGRDLRELPLAMRAIERWRTLGEELCADLHYRRDGNLTLAESEEELAALEARVARERALGLDVRIVDRDELRELVPDISPRVRGGSWCPSDGHAMPSLVTYAFARAAVRAGARIVERTRVTGIVVRSDRIDGATTTAAPVSCRAVVVAAGAWSAEVARTAGLAIPVEPCGLQMLVTEPMPHRLRPVLGSVGRRLSLKQLPGGAYLIGGGWPATCDARARRTRLRPESISGSASDATAVLPLLSGARLVRAWAGIEGMAVDDVPLLGHVPGIEGLVLACGFSGHGFALAPAVGEAIAELVTTGRPQVAIEPLSPARVSAF